MEDNAMGKVLILGGTGMVGSQCDWPNTIKYSSKECNVTDYNAVVSAIEREQPKVIMSLAAKIDLKWCEDNPYDALKINTFGVGNVALACREKNIKLVYMSSTAIFPDDIIHEPRKGIIPKWYPEDIVENSPNVYGKTKLLGEQIVREFCPDALIIRPGRMFGGGYKYDSKFARVCYETLVSGKDYSGYTNHYCSLIYIPDLWKAIQVLLKLEISGIEHIANNGPPVSLYDVCLFIKENGQLQGALHKSIAKQGANGYMATANQSIYSLIKLRTWQEAMREYLEILKIKP